MSKYQKKTTFTMKPSCPQIFAYIITLAQILTFYIIIIVQLTDLPTKVILCILYSLAFLFKFGLAFYISGTDPSDKCMVQLKTTTDSRQLIMKINNNSDNYLYCDECLSFVQSNSKHCRNCNRCVSGFDHHCKWINNCVGQLNYKSFIALIIIQEIEMTLYLISIGLLWGQRDWEYYVPKMIAIWTMLGIISVLWLLVLHLIILHFYLIYQGLTTYQLLFGGSSNRQRNRKNVVMPINQLKVMEKTEQNMIQNKKCQKASQDMLSENNQQSLSIEKENGGNHFEQHHQQLNFITEQQQFPYNKQQSDNQNRNITPKLRTSNSASASILNKPKQQWFKSQNRSLSSLLSSFNVNQLEKNKKIADNPLICQITL